MNAPRVVGDRTELAPRSLAPVARRGRSLSVAIHPVRRDRGRGVRLARPRPLAHRPRMASAMRSGSSARRSCWCSCSIRCASGCRRCTGRGRSACGSGSTCCSGCSARSIILYHARFTYSATNSGVALLAMLIVVASGLTGRFIYGHVHRGFSQRKIETRELLDELAQSRLLLDADGNTGHHVVQRLERLERAALVKRLTLFGNATAMLSIGVRSRILYWQLLRTIRSEAGDRGERARSCPTGRSCFTSARSSGTSRNICARSARWAGSSSTTGCFAPGIIFTCRLFFFLLATATLHIVAVHMY